MGKDKASKRKEKGLKNGEGRGRGRAEGGGPPDGTVAAPIGDPRFSRLHTDPRFQRLPKNKGKVSIDSRFARMFSEKGFNDPSVNKRGIKSKSSTHIDPLRRYYKLDEEDEHEESDVDAQAERASTTKKRGKKDRAKKNKEEDRSEFLVAGKGVDPEEKLGSAVSVIDMSLPRKQSGKKNRFERKLDGRPGVQITEGEVDSEDSGEELEQVAGELDGQAHRKRVGKGFVAEGESDEESEDEDESRLDEGEEQQGGDDDSLASSSSSSSSDSESDVEEEDLPEAEDTESIPTTSDETRRLAMMNMDWEHIRAVHLLVLMRSFVPKGGRVSSVTIYPSEFGIEQMEEESKLGPRGIFRQQDGDDEDDEEGADPEKLRAYEKAKLSYYYAVVECDSASTAAHLYKNCDGLEFERTSNTLDLRYIPDEMEFKRAPRDVATEVPANYKPIEFETRALQHSNVKLTWDDDEPVRAKALGRNFSRDELDEMDFRAYVASSSESESEADEDATTVDEDQSIEPKAEADKKEKVRSKYLSLLAGTEESGKVHGRKAEKGNIEIKFHTGLDELSEKLLTKAKKDKDDSTVWEAYLRRKKEKKNARKNRKAATDSDVSSQDGETQNDNHQDDPFFSHGDEDPFDDPFFNQDSKIRKGRESKEGKTKKDLNGSSKEKGRKKKEDDAREKEAGKKQAELELLLLDDHMVPNGEELQKIPSLRNSLKKQKLKKKKGANGKREELQEKIHSSANLDDPRFASLFTSHHFALDPTDPQYKKTSSHVAEKQRQQFQSSNHAKEELDNIGEQPGVQGSNRKRKAELSSLVRSLKSKVEAKALRNEQRLR